MLTINFVCTGAFRCPCGFCSLESYLKDGCPKSKLEAFPFLDLSKINKCDKENLIQKLSNEMDEMQEAFGELFDDISQSLSSRGVTPKQLAKRVLCLGTHSSGNVQRPLCEENKQKLIDSTSIDMSFIILIDHVSLFNFELLAWIIKSKQLCSDKDREQLLDYRKKFETFCRRKVFEVPFHTLRQETADYSIRSQTNFAVLMTVDESEYTLLDADKARRKIATLFNLGAGTVHLQWIDKGSLIVVFSVPTFIAERLFPLNSHQIHCLKCEGFTVFAVVETGMTHLYRYAIM